MNGYIKQKTLLSATNKVNNIFHIEVLFQYVCHYCGMYCFHHLFSVCDQDNSQSYWRDCREIF